MWHLLLLPCLFQALYFYSCTDAATLSLARYDLVATSVGSKALFAGGYSYATPYGEGAASAVVDLYDVSSSTWSVANLSLARGALAATSVGSKALFGGGVDGAGTPEFFAVVEVYDVNSGTWSLSSLSSARSDLVATSVGSKALFAGGFDYFDYSAVVDIFDLSNGAWTAASLSFARSDLAATSVGSKALFAGGYATSGCSAVVDIYELNNETWTIANLSLARAELAATVLGPRHFSREVLRPLATLPWLISTKSMKTRGVSPI